MIYIFFQICVVSQLKFSSNTKQKETKKNSRAKSSRVAASRSQLGHPFDLFYYNRIQINCAYFCFPIVLVFLYKGAIICVDLSVLIIYIYIRVSM